MVAIVQLVSSKYAKQRIGMANAGSWTIILMENGTPMEDVTEIKPGKDRQYVFVNTAGFQIDVPFECFSENYDKVMGCVRAGVNVHVPVRSIRLIKESPISASEDIVEFSDSDLVSMIKGNIQYTIRTECASMLDSMSPDQASKAITNRLNYISGYWLEYGLKIDFRYTAITEADYNDAVKAMKEAEARELARNIEIVEARQNADHAIEMHNVESRAKNIMELTNIQHGLEIDKKLMESQAEKDALRSEIAHEKELREKEFADRLEEMELEHRNKVQQLERDAELNEEERKARIEYLRCQSEIMEIEKRKHEIELDIMKSSEKHRQRMEEAKMAIMASGGTQVRRIKFTDVKPFCPKCGLEAALSKAVFCRICGTKLDAPQRPSLRLGEDYPEEPADLHLPAVLQLTDVVLGQALVHYLDVRHGRIVELLRLDVEYIIAPDYDSRFGR